MSELLPLLSLPAPDTLGDPSAGQSAVPGLSATQWFGCVVCLVGLIIWLLGCVMLLATRSEAENQQDAKANHLFLHAVLNIQETWGGLLVTVGGLLLMAIGANMVR